MNALPIPHNIIDKLRPICDEISFPKEHILFGNNKIENNIYIIKYGIARAYIEADGKDITIWFGRENDIIISANGYVNGVKGYETMQLLEDSVLYRINLALLSALYKHDIGVCNWARRLIEKEFVRTEQHLISVLSMTAAERYTQLLNENPEILQRVQLQHIASYLGITPEHLSRIRAKKIT